MNILEQIRNDALVIEAEGLLSEEERLRWEAYLEANIKPISEALLQFIREGERMRDGGQGGKNA